MHRQVMERCWFSGRCCLDVGCNSGVLTLALATRFGTASMHGVDIDKPLVQMACRHLAAEHVSATERLAAARAAGRGGHSGGAGAAGAKESMVRTGNVAPHKVPASTDFDFVQSSLN